MQTESSTMTEAATPINTSPDFSSMFADLKATFETERTMNLAWRAEQLTALEHMMEECEQEFMDALKSDLGKHHQEAWTTEISFVASDASYSRKRLKRWTKKRRVRTPMLGQPGKSWLQPEPLGVVLIIGAWNYPLQLTLAGLAAAIAAGNCAVVKPSELAPATSEVIARRVPEYLDGECVKIVEGAVAETTALLELPWDHILYTGGGNVGRIVMTAAAKHLTSVTLELGGKSPCVVMPDADLLTTARRIAWGKFTNAGQTCIAPDYVLVDAETKKKLIPLLQQAVTEMFGENPEESDSFGRIVSDRHFERLAKLMDSGEAVIGGQINADSKYIAPTVLTGVSVDSPIMQDEIFGPILPVLIVDDLEAAIRFIRASDKPLAAYIFTKDANAEARFLKKVSCGNTCVNDTMMFMMVDELPFGGVGPSGMGNYSGEHGFSTFSHMKAVMKRGWWPDVALRYAPFTEGKFKMLRKLR
ncbi:MAG: aldehyde dehydrogenase family protein [Gammaproteobacteria bacterium]|nr:aldehyde dehydrogenase family protein [Gammaproteobacteria bacterium]